jgi:dolichol-phosphate mannosyltransferase
MLSVVIPTYNEAENIGELLSRLSVIIKGLDPPSEVIIVDDSSPDKTQERALAFSDRLDLRIINRPDKLGLSSAIMDGIRLSRGELIVVMDADLSHPPELIPEMLSSSPGHDIVVASRYMPGGGTPGWSMARKTASSLGRLAAMPVASSSDPLSGFFLIRRGVARRVSFKPRGFKPLLDILIRSDAPRINEVPYKFSPRKRGSSKLGISTILAYANQLSRLYLLTISHTLCSSFLKKRS